MNRYFRLLILFSLVILLPLQALATLSYLDTKDKSTLSLNQYLVSPLGYFKLKLLPNCSMQLQEFNSSTNKYQLSSNFNLGLQNFGQCTSLDLSTNNQAVTGNNGIIIKPLTQGSIIYSRFVLRVNDIGQVYIVKFLGKNEGGYQQQKVLLHQNNLDPNARFVYFLTSKQVYVNKNNWTFTNEFRILNISHSSDPQGKIQKIIYLNNYQLTEQGIFFQAQNQKDYITIPGGKYLPRAGNYSCGYKNQGVFLEFDQYWPIIRLYNRDKYLVAQYTVDQLKQKICPERTFMHKNQCLTECPEPFLKQIRGGYGRCVLNCETGSNIDEVKKTCTSNNYESHLNFNFNKILNRNCPANSVQYEYGCICQKSLFYDFLKNTCVQKCPDGTFGAKGICISCNKNCKGCQIDKKGISYLSCTNCSQGHSGPRCNISPTECKNIPNCLACSIQNSIEQCIKCSPFYALSSNKQGCYRSCNTDEVLVVGSGGQAYCNAVNSALNTQFIGGQFQGQSYVLRKSGTCPPGQRIFRDKCVITCNQDLQLNSENRCICRKGFATFQNDTCVNISQIQKNYIGYYYNSTYNAFLNCPIGCVACQYNFCFKCSPDHILMIGSSSSGCKQRSSRFSCNSEYFTYDSANKICFQNNALKVSNIINCQNQLRGKCIICKKDFILSQGSCVRSCPGGYFNADGRCIKNLNQCTISSLRSSPMKTKVNFQTLNSPIYKLFSMKNTQISNQPITQLLQIQKELGLDVFVDSQQQLQTALYYPQIYCKVPVGAGQPNILIPPTPTPTPTPIVVPPSANKIQVNCTDPQKPYLSVSGGCVANCTLGTFPFKHKAQNTLMCVTQTQCYGLNKSKPFQLIDGTCVDDCPPDTIPVVFGVGRIVQCQSITECQKINRMMPFKLQNSECSSSCPAGSTPKLTQNGQLLCEDAKTAPPRINIDSSVYRIGSDIVQSGSNYKIYYFVLDSVLNKSDIIVNYYGQQHGNHNRPKPMVMQVLSQSAQSTSLPNIVDSTIINNKTHLSIRTTADEVVLDLSKNIKQFETANGNRLSSSIYGVRQGENRLHNTRSWLAIIAYVLSLLLICLHAIYTGNQLLYKVDNFLIFAQSLYYFSFVHLLINASIGQFYYGFLWSHFGFYPNYFAGTIPSLYMQGFQSFSSSKLPNSYRLLTGDANFIRNAGFSFSLLATFIAGFLVVCLVILLLKKVCGKYQIWYKRIAKCALIAGIQFVSMNIFYWAVAHLMYNQSYLFSGYPNQPQNHVSFRLGCSLAAIAWICVYGIYMIVRFVKNKIGGLYMFKRLAFATILAASAYRDNGDNGYKLFLIPMVAAQIIFMILRFVLEQPYLRRQRYFIILQSVLMIASYCAIYLWNDTGFISIFVSLIFFFFIFLFTSDLLDVYLDNKDQFYDDNMKILPGLRHKQFINGEEYQKINNGASLPDTQRRLKTDKNS